MMGSGSFIIMDEDTCMVDVAKYFLSFTMEESCGKCTPCREGTKHMLNILNDITAGKAKMEDAPSDNSPHWIGDKSLNHRYHAWLKRNGWTPAAAKEVLGVASMYDYDGDIGDAFNALMAAAKG